MSSTISIGILRTDPITVEWLSADIAVRAMHGALSLSKFRSCTLSFPALTSAQYASWMAICDDNQNHTLTSFPGLCVTTYSNSPGAYDGTTITPEGTYDSNGTGFEGEYRLHFLGSRHSTGVYIYDTKILVYLRRQPDCPIPAEFGYCSGLS